MFHRFLLIVYFISFPLDIYANNGQQLNQPPIENIKTFSTINITTKRIKNTLGSTHIITKEIIDSYNNTALVDLLNNQANININRIGSFGQSALIRLNGSPAYHIVILLDGVKLEDPSNVQSFFDIGQIPLNMIEEIEITQGASSVTHGSGALAGVINIKTTKTTKNTAFINQKIGSFSTYDTQSGFNLHHNRLNLNFFANLYKSKGYSLSDNILNINSQSPLENDNVNIKNFNLKASYQFLNKSLLDVFIRLNDSYIEYDNFSPSIGPYDAEGNYTDKKENFYYLKYNFIVFKNNSNEIVLSQLNTHKKYTELSTFGNTENVFSSLSRIFNYKSIYTRNFINITGGMDFENHNTKMDNNLSTNNMALYAKTTQYLWKNTALEQGIRYNINNRNNPVEVTKRGKNIVYNFGLLHNIQKISTTFNINYGTAYRLPSLFELFASHIGNNELIAETSSGLNIGIQKNNFLSYVPKINLNIFHLKVNDMINFQNNKYRNIGNYNNYGFDINTPIIMGNLTIIPNYAYLSTNNKTTNIPSYIFPKHKIGLLSKITIKNIYEISLQSIWKSQATDFTNRLPHELPSYTVHNMQISYNFFKKSKAYFQIDNLLNKKYQAVYGYKSQNRSYYFGISLER